MLLVAQLCPTLCDPMDGSLCSWDSPGRNTGVGCHFLLHGIFPTQGSNPDLPHCRQILTPSELSGKPQKNTGVGCHFLFQEIFPTKGLNLCLLSLLHWQVNCLPVRGGQKPDIDVAIPGELQIISEIYYHNRSKPIIVP